MYTQIYFVAGIVAVILVGFLIQRNAMERRKWWLPMVITALVSAITWGVCLRYNTGEDTLTFLMWFFPAGISLLLLLGMVFGWIFSRVIRKMSGR